KDTYTDLLISRRKTMRKLAETIGSGEPPAVPEKDVLGRLYYDLRTRRIQLRLERAEVETLLARRKKGEGAATDPARKEIAQLEDRLAVLTASQSALDEEFERLTHEMHGAARLGLDLESNKEEIAFMEEAVRNIAAEVEAMAIELEAPPRIRVIQDAVSPN